ncbi:MAG: SIS domain-containing protein [Clostridia bacterium]|nr:SIS domain-containing protein [Clostridia bacterium]
MMLEQLNGVYKTIDPGAAASMAEAVDRYGRIFVYGGGRTGLMLKAFAMRLVQLGKTAYAVGETITPAIGAGDLLVVASASGSTPLACHFAETAKRGGADLYVITSPAPGRLSAVQAPQVTIDAPNKDTASSDRYPMGTLFEQALLLFLDDVVGHMHGNAETMRAIHANLE